MGEEFDLGAYPGQPLFMNQFAEEREFDLKHHEDENVLDQAPCEFSFKDDELDFETKPVEIIIPPAPVLMEVKKSNDQDNYDNNFDNTVTRSVEVSDGSNTEEVIMPLSVSGLD